MEILTFRTCEEPRGVNLTQNKGKNQMKSSLESYAFAKKPPKETIAIC